MLWQAAAFGAVLLMAPAGVPPPRPTVMLVEMGRTTGYGGMYEPPGADPDSIPWHAYIRAQVRPFRTFSGRRYRRPVVLEYVAHADYVPGLVLLVIATPNRRAPGLFARWYTHRQDDRGRYCVPEGVVAELGVQRAFRGAAQATYDGQAMRCIFSNQVTLDR